MELNDRISLLNKYLSEEHNGDYIKLKKCKDKAISMSLVEYMQIKQDNYYSNLWSCVYDFKKNNSYINENMKELMQLMKDIDFNVNKNYVIHNFKVINNIR